MTDSVAVFPPGYRLTDSDTGAPISGATLEFYDAGTATPKTVYATSDLDQGENPAPLGTSVTTDSLGRPTSDGSAPTDVYVDTKPYKVVIKDGSGVVLETKDNRKGAVVSADSVNLSVTSTFPVATKSLAYQVVSADQNTTFLVNCSSADVTLTLPSATDDDIPNGWGIKVQHAGSANQALIAVKSGSGQTIREGTKAYNGGTIALALNGEDCEIVADGGNWRVVSHTPPFVKMGQTVIPITDRISTSPASPQAGALYLLTGIGGSFSTFAINDIVQYTGSGYINWTPYTDCGWLVYIQDEDLYYSYQNSGWVAGTLFRGAIVSEMKSLAVNRKVTADMQHFHPGHPKAWVNFNGTGTIAIKQSYNVASLTDNGTGTYSVNFLNNMSSVNYAVFVSANFSAGTAWGGVGTKQVGSVNVNIVNNGTAADLSDVHVLVFGDA